MAQFTSAGGGGVPVSATFGGATTPSIANVVSTGAEQSYALPAGSTDFMIQSRSLTTIQLYYSTGASDTVTIPRGCFYKRSGIDASASITIFFQALDPGRVIEIESWK